VAVARAPLTSSDDAIFDGAVLLAQPARGHGYRTNVDAILLAAFAARARPARLALDLGAGVGAVALALDHLGGARSVVLVERQPALAALAVRNLAANGLGDRGSVVEADLAAGLPRIAPDLVAAADLVVANPPYVTAARDRTERGLAERWQARHGELAPFVRAAADAIAARGRACFVYPAHALLDLLSLARALGLEPKRLRMVHGSADRPARVVLVEMLRGKPGGLVVEAPLVETSGGARSAELAALLAAPRRALTAT
jgi:tRNA1Val (adenine37-N6)-methyltransferase